jgi:hypothetical protein
VRAPAWACALRATSAYRTGDGGGRRRGVEGTLARFALQHLKESTAIFSTYLRTYLVSIVPRQVLPFLPLASLSAVHTYLASMVDAACAHRNGRDAEHSNFDPFCPWRWQATQMGCIARIRCISVALGVWDAPICAVHIRFAHAECSRCGAFTMCILCFNSLHV